MDPSTSLLKMEQIAHKGRGLFATQPLKAGQLVLRESPLILCSASPLINPQSSFSYCDHCFRILPPKDTVPCPSCSHHHFCTQNCLSLALKSHHTSLVCQALSSLTHSVVLMEQPFELQAQARYLVAAYNLAIMSPSDLHTLLSLHGTPDASILDASHFLHSLISPLFPAPHDHILLSVDLTAQLLAKNKRNSVSLMSHCDSPDGPQGSIKAYAIYPKATIFNHDCLPSACRFHCVDSTSDEHNTDIFIRMIQDVPEGREVCLSYIRINQDYSTRKRILMEDYGFTCDCDRCKIEANWPDCQQNHEEYSDLPHVRFLSKYVCDRKNCEGILAPLPPKDDAPSNVLECNFCGNLKFDDP